MYNISFTSYSTVPAVSICLAPLEQCYLNRPVSPLQQVNVAYMYKSSILHKLNMMATKLLGILYKFSSRRLTFEAGSASFQQASRLHICPCSRRHGECSRTNTDQPSKDVLNLMNRVLGRYMTDR